MNTYAAGAELASSILQTYGSETARQVLAGYTDTLSATTHSYAPRTGFGRESCRECGAPRASHP